MFLTQDEICFRDAYCQEHTEPPFGGAKIASDYMGQLIEWPEVITEGAALADCRERLQDAAQEMIAAYRRQEKEIPPAGALLEQILVMI